MRSHKQGDIFKSNINTSTTNSKVSELPSMHHHHTSSVYKNMVPTKSENVSSRHRINKLQGINVQDMNIFAKTMDAILLDNGKHPVTKLNEIMELLNKKKIEYSYLEVNKELEDTDNFKCTAKSDCINAYGTGVSKKDAKKNAAIDFINKFKSNFANVLTDENKHFFAEQEVNYVGMLQNFCMAISSQLPDYEFIKDDENLNNIFTAKCHLYGFTTKGEGKSKQTAKRKAADLMYNQIKDIPRDRILKHYLNALEIPSRVSEKIDDSVNHTFMQLSVVPNKIKYSVNHRLIQPNKVSEQINDPVKPILIQPIAFSEEKNDSVNQTLMQPSSVLKLMNNPENSITTKPKNSVFNNLDSFFDKIKSSKKPTLIRLRDMNRLQLCALDTIQMLYDIANEEDFTVKFESIPNHSSGAVKVKVNLSVSPTLIHLGKGPTAINAFKQASYNVLAYLQMIMNKSKP